MSVDEAPPAEAAVVAEASEASAEPSEPAPVDLPPPAVPKKKGRPVGAKDRQPRTRRPVTVRVEPIVEAPRVDTSRPAREEPALAPEPEDPPTPRTQYRETSKRLVHLRGLIHEGRRSAVESAFTAKLASWPLV
jgi:hypothetical protein